MLFTHPKVQEVSVVGVADEIWGALITAFVVRSDNQVTPAELDAFCRSSDELANYKRPRKYVFLDDLPKKSSGKIDRKPLRAWKFPA